MNKLNDIQNECINLFFMNDNNNDSNQRYHKKDILRVLTQIMNVYNQKTNNDNDDGSLFLDILLYEPINNNNNNNNSNSIMKVNYSRNAEKTLKIFNIYIMIIKYDKSLLRMIHIYYNLY